MDVTLFDRLTRGLVAAPSRRRVLFGLGALAVPGLTDAREKRKKHKTHKKDKKRRCPQSRRCGKSVCCPSGEICAGAACVIGQGACATGSDSCASGFAVLCAENCLCVSSTEGATRCSQGGFGLPCGSCTSSADCAKYGALAFCAAAGPGCGCQEGQGVCVFACFG
jgi:hypothetical protein